MRIPKWLRVIGLSLGVFSTLSLGSVYMYYAFAEGYWQPAVFVAFGVLGVLTLFVLILLIKGAIVMPERILLRILSPFLFVMYVFSAFAVYFLVGEVVTTGSLFYSNNTFQVLLSLGCMITPTTALMLGYVVLKANNSSLPRAAEDLASTISSTVDYLELITNLDSGSSPSSPSLKNAVAAMWFIYVLFSSFSVARPYAKSHPGNPILHLVSYYGLFRVAFLNIPLIVLRAISGYSRDSETLNTMFILKNLYDIFASLAPYTQQRSIKMPEDVAYDSLTLIVCEQLEVEFDKTHRLISGEKTQVKEALRMIAKLVDKLDEHKEEIQLSAASVSLLSLEKLQQIEENYGVKVSLQEDKLRILGRKGPVTKACDAATALYVPRDAESRA